MKKLISGLVLSGLVISNIGVNISDKAFAATESKLFINEVMADNESVIQDADGEYSDWIEFYNSSSSPIDLTGYTLSDSSATWKFPVKSIQPGGYLLVWASDKDKVDTKGAFHTNFKIGSTGETITLKNTSGAAVDSLAIENLGKDQTFARKNDGSTECVVLLKGEVSPEKANQYINEPIFDKQGGFYDQFDLHLTTNEAGAAIYYTLDGSDPVPGNAKTIKYENKITVKSRVGEANIISQPTYFHTKNNINLGEVFKGTVVKAAVWKDGKSSRIVTNSYFIDKKEIAKRYSSLPVISLAANDINFNSTSELPLHIEFYKPNGELGFSKYCTSKVHGASSNGYPQRSLRLYADRGLDLSNKISCQDIFEEITDISGNKITSFERLILRNSGNDTMSTMFRDGLMHSLASNMNIDTQAYRPAVAFLNGEFWGIYNIRERYDNKYFESHYNLDKDKVVLLTFPATNSDPFEVNEGNKEDLKAYINDILCYLVNNPLSDEANYLEIQKRVDIDNFIDYVIANVFYANSDWINNNVVAWKFKTSDGKYKPDAPYGQDGRWRWALKDTDFAFTKVNASTLNDKAVKFKMPDGLTQEEQIKYITYNANMSLISFFLDNDSFKEKFISRFNEHLKTTFAPDVVKAKIEEIKATIEPAMDEHINRWAAITDWEGNVQVLTQFADGRTDAMRQRLQDYFNTNFANADLPFIYGDLNEDGIFDSGDYSYMRGCLLGTRKINTMWGGFAADVNNDGVIDSADYSLMRKSLLNTTSLPASETPKSPNKAFTIEKDISNKKIIINQIEDASYGITVESYDQESKTYQLEETQELINGKISFDAVPGKAYKITLNYSKTGKYIDFTTIE